MIALAAFHPRPISVLAAVLITMFTLAAFFMRQDQYRTPTDLVEIGQLYANSQYVKGDATQMPIADEVVYLFAADAYMKGQDPTSVNFEHPPLGKYLIGISLRLFHNGAAINLFLLPTLLATLFLIGKTLRLSPVAQVIALCLIGSSSLLLFYSGEALMDISQAVFSALFLLALVRKQHPLLVGVALGLLITTKYFFPALGLYILIMIVGQGVRKTVVSLATAGGVYLLSYSVYFLNHSPLDWLKFEWYRFRWWTGDRSMPKLLIFSTIFLGKFKTWWDDGYQVHEHWNLTWPLFTLLAVAALPFIKKKPETVIALYTFGTLALFAVGAAAFERYLIQILPFMTLLSVFFVERLVEKFFPSFFKRYDIV